MNQTTQEETNPQVNYNLNFEANWNSACCSCSWVEKNQPGSVGRASTRFFHLWSIEIGVMRSLAQKTVFYVLSELKSENSSSFANETQLDSKIKTLEQTPSLAHCLIMGLRLN